ncbi:MAG: hypothetical protein K6C14_08060, partial [Eubacterium sp.]|nr:hypothetical protein [Eubacterium sp.]
MAIEETPKIKYKNLKFFISAIGLVLVFCLIFNTISRIVVHPHDEKGFSMVGNYYEEEENSLDVVFIGSSTTYAAWNPIIAWKQFGITAYGLTTPDQPLYAAKYLCKEARKTQPDALYIFNLVTLCQYFDEDPYFAFHALLDYMPLSWNRIMIAKSICDTMGYEYKDNIELFIPLVRYHEQWKDWDAKYLNKKLDTVRGVAHYTRFLTKVDDVTENFTYTPDVVDFKPEHETLRTCIKELLAYLKEENVNAMFITTPTAGKEHDVYGYINKAVEMTREAGFTVLDMQSREKLDEIGIDITRDFYNMSHLNVHGSMKMTKYLGKYIVDEYGFKNKNGDKSYSAGASWDHSYNNYIKKIKPYVLEQEYTFKTDNHFICPKIRLESVNGTEVKLFWHKAEGADGYAIYKKSDKKLPYELVTQGELSDLTYTDKGEKGKTYTYIVVAYKGSGDKQVWSTYNPRGTEAVIPK